MIALVDYGMGNLRSVEKALQKVGGEVRPAKTPEDLERADRIVLPGVGAFGDCMRNLKTQNLIDPLRKSLGGGKPFLGICLGYQALFESSAEEDGLAGLGFFKGTVVRFPDNGLKIPQIGWNQIHVRLPECPLLRNVPTGEYVYFVHSYFPKPVDTTIVAAETEYGQPFAAMVARDRVFACQFHPEKSQTIGLKILENFVRLKA